MVSLIAKNAWLVPATVASVSLAASIGLGTMGAYTASLTAEENTVALTRW